MSDRPGLTESGRSSVGARAWHKSPPFLCQSCWVRSDAPYFERMRGWVCPACLQPLVPTKPRPKRKPKSQRVRATVSLRRSSARTVAERDGWNCWLCGHAVDPTGRGPHRPSVDHVVQRRHGGTRALENLRLAHQSCNEFREGANVAPYAPFELPLAPNLGGS